MRRAILGLSLPALLLALGCGGVVDTLRDLSDAVVSPSAAALAARHCRPALDNAHQYEDVPPIGERDVSVCESWYAQSASEDELTALACMAEARDQSAWTACRAPFARTEEAAARAVVHRGAPRRPTVLVAVATRDIDGEIAANGGVLAALLEGSELDHGFGSSGLDADLTAGFGGLIGAKGTEIGSGGLDSPGSGGGGGGGAEALGGLGTRGRGASGYGSGGGHFGGSSGGVEIVAGDPLILGGLDRTLIEPVVELHMSQIRYCYQRVLVSSPELAGKIVVKLVIAEDGAVSSSVIESSTMGNSAVEDCLASRFLRFMFPEPAGGGIVTVSYPFLFQPS